MADATADEDAPLLSLHKHINNDDNDPSDEQQDFRFLAALTAGSNGQHKIPKRGEKDFEPHGTKQQDAVLAASRQAMHDVLDHTRVHVPKSNCRAWYFGDNVLDSNGDDAEETDVMSDAVRGRGLDRDHVVMVESSRGTQYRTMGKASLGKTDSRIWLLPEEALYLVERGNLDLWWPLRPLAAVRGQVKAYGIESLEDDNEEDGFPLSLQAAYALLVGQDEENGKVSLDRYIVYANLKRTGYVVARDRKQDLSYGSPNTHEPGKMSSLFNWLFGAFFAEQLREHAPYGPLVKPGLYRSYDKIYRQLSVLPRHKPTPEPTATSSPQQDSCRLVYNIWKPSRIPNFAKSKPGIPDFRIAVVSSRATTLPSLTQLVSLLESSPWDPPKKEWIGPGNSYQRLRHGWRNVILAVVDQGVISYLRMSEAAFGEEKLYTRFDGGNVRGGKKGAARGRGRGRGRGR